MPRNRGTDPTIELDVSSDLRLVDLVHAAAEKVAELAGFDEDDALNVGLAVREAVINAMLHGNRKDPSLRVRVGLTAARDGITARVLDQGAGFDPDATPDPTDASNVLNASGRGLLLMRAFVDEVRFDYRAGRGMEIRLIKRRTTAGPPRDGAHGGSGS
jgi:serine/threonine-protein kinase RsbW